MRATIVLASALALVSWGCSSSSGQREGAEDASLDDGGVLCLTCPSDASIDASPLVLVKGEIDRVCSDPDGCHGIGVADMGLTPGHEFDAMINVVSFENAPMLRVKPGDPDHSYVYLKVACEGGISGHCMPFSTGFDPNVKKMFLEWIEAGAPTQ